MKKAMLLVILYFTTTVTLAANTYIFNVTNPDNPISPANGTYAVTNCRGIENCPANASINQTIALTIPPKDLKNGTGYLTLESPKYHVQEGSKTYYCNLIIELTISTTGTFNIAALKTNPPQAAKSFTNTSCIATSPLVEPNKN